MISTKNDPAKRLGRAYGAEFSPVNHRICQRSRSSGRFDLFDLFDIMYRMVKVEFTAEAKRGLEEIPLVIQFRCYGIIDRLQRWPEVSGAKPLRGELKGCFRIRTGDWRIVFRPEGSVLWIVRIDNRKDVYER